jgi:DNA (cytosine-5)-methyltransferase 1
MKKIKIGELFSGPGGLALGAYLAAKKTKLFEFEHAWAVDNHEHTCETYIRNIPGASSDSVFCEDIRTFNMKNLRNVTNEINGFAFGFPCNDFSVVGEQKGMGGDYGPLYTFGLKVLNMFEPDFFVAENVSGLASANKGQALKKILDDLQHAGPNYVLTPYLYKFEEYGVPQARHRLIIVGFKKSLGLKFRPPKQTHLEKFVSVRDAIEKKPIKLNAFNNEKTIQSELVVKRLSYIKPGQNAWTAKIPKAYQLNVKGAKLSQIYKRLDPDKPSYTITGSGGGGTHVYHWLENRALTNRERARLQTFPDNFEFIGSKESVRRQIGMAVPPEGARVIFEAIFKSLHGVDYDYIKDEDIYIPGMRGK